MRVLLDTHAFLWALLDAPELSETARDVFADRQNTILLSTASLWELAIKASLGKLHTSRPLLEWLPEEIARNALTLLPPSVDHVLRIEKLPFHHRDPFDRLLIAQAQSEDVPLLSRDTTFDAYSVQRIW